jgi:hypothetical protein
VITVVDKAESKLIIRSSPKRGYMRRVWPTTDSYDSVTEEDLQLDEDVDNVVEQSYTPKRKHTLEKDEIEGK